MNKTNHLRGKDSPCYKNGIGEFIRFRKSLKQKVCNRCGKDLTNVSRYEWCVHHKNHDRNCNRIDNFEVLCKRCHQLEHGCVNKLQIVYTKTCYMCGTVFQSKANNAKYCGKCNPIYRRWKHKYTPDEIKTLIMEGNV